MTEQAPLIERLVAAFDDWYTHRTNSLMDTRAQAWSRFAAAIEEARASRSSAPSDTRTPLPNELCATCGQMRQYHEAADHSFAQMPLPVSIRAAAPSEGPTLERVGKGPDGSHRCPTCGAFCVCAEWYDGAACVHACPALPVPAQEAEAEDLDLVADYLDPNNGPYLDGDDAKALANRLHNLAARLRSPSEIPEADTVLLDWLESEHARVDPVARLVVKRSRDRNSSDWADVSHDVRGTLQSLASPENSMAEQKLRQVRPHTVGSNYICGRCEKSHIVGCDADGLIGSLICPNRPLASRPSDSSRSDTEAS